LYSFLTKATQQVTQRAQEMMQQVGLTEKAQTRAGLEKTSTWQQFAGCYDVASCCPADRRSFIRWAKAKAVALFGAHREASSGLLGRANLRRG